MKYIFEYNEIKKCIGCPFAMVFMHDDEIRCKLNGKWYRYNAKPKDCPLEVEE